MNNFKVEGKIERYEFNNMYLKIDKENNFVWFDYVAEEKSPFDPSVDNCGTLVEVLERLKRLEKINGKYLDDCIKNKYYVLYNQVYEENLIINHFIDILKESLLEQIA